MMIRKLAPEMPEIDAQTILDAHQRIAPFIHQTPVLTSHALDARAGAQLFFKCENFQKVGAFKARGAMNAVLQTHNPAGVATHSSGNHGQALAWAAAQKGLPATVVMPENAPQVKKDAVQGYGGRIVECEPTLAAREATLEKVVDATGATFIHPYNNAQVIAGQATAARELLLQQADLDAIVAPVGGGGLLAGTALSAHFFGRGVQVYAGEPAGANDAWQSFQAGKLIPLQKANTIADGLRTSMGSLTFPVMMNHVSDVFTVTDQEIVAAWRLIMERLKIVIEPSCAVPFAAVCKHPEVFSGKRVGIILTGGNVDLNPLFV